MATINYKYGSLASGLLIAAHHPGFYGDHLDRHILDALYTPKHRKALTYPQLKKKLWQRKGKLPGTTTLENRLKLLKDEKLIVVTIPNRKGHVFEAAKGVSTGFMYNKNIIKIIHTLAAEESRDSGITQRMVRAALSKFGYGRPHLSVIEAYFKRMHIEGYVEWRSETATAHKVPPAKAKKL